MFDFELETWTNLKLERDRLRRQGEGGVSFNKVYSKTDENNTRNTVSIVGNPSLAEVKVIMIGVRNNANEIKSGEWVSSSPRRRR